MRLRYMKKRDKNIFMLIPAMAPSLVSVVFCGGRAYKPMLSLQRHIFSRKIARQKQIQLAERQGTGITDAASHPKPLHDVVLCIEHIAPVYTMGRRDTANGLLTSDPNESMEPNAEGDLVKDGIPVVLTKRGGGLTWHGPGQLTCYPIVNIRNWWQQSQHSLEVKGKSPTRWYSDVLEESMIKTCAAYGVPGHRRCVGVWCMRMNSEAEGRLNSPALAGYVCTKKVPLDDSTDDRKIGSVGLQLSDWVSMHGIGLNVSNELSYFDKIVMCELPGKRATNLHQEIRDRGEAFPLPTVADVQQVWASSLQSVSGLPPSAVTFQSVDMRALPDEQLTAAVDALLSQSHSDSPNLGS